MLPPLSSTDDNEGEEAEHCVAARPLAEDIVVVGGKVALSQLEDDIEDAIEVVILFLLTSVATVGLVEAALDDGLVKAALDDGLVKVALDNGLVKVALDEHEECAEWLPVAAAGDVVLVEVDDGAESGGSRKP